MLYVRTFFAGFNKEKQERCELNKQELKRQLARFVHPHLSALDARDRAFLWPA
jgi:hypothetical protein